MMPNLVEKPKPKVGRRPKEAKTPKKGQLCHHCRGKHELFVKCSRPNCSLKFCAACLSNRHGEKFELERAANVNWVCPRCRRGCGEGCQKSCCHCSTCRKIRNLKPTGKITVRHAREGGFTNMHDYLVHLQTGETPAAIADRKKGRRWTSIDAVSEDKAIPAIAHMENGHELISIDPVSENKVNSISENHVSENYGLESHASENLPTFIDYEALVSKDLVRRFIECEPSDYDDLIQDLERNSTLSLTKKEPREDEDFFA